MAKELRFGRLLTAMVTPFKEDGAIDHKRIGELAPKLIAEGNEGLIVNGTTGESPTISRDERCELFSAVIDAVDKDVPLIANVGDNCTQDSVDFAKRVTALGGGRINGIMVVTPYYNKPPQEGLYQHFRAVAEAVDVPVILYNIPGRSVINLEPKTILHLAQDVENIRGLKQANDDITQLRMIVHDTPSDFEVFSGDDAFTLPNLQHGGDGVISTTGNIAAHAMRSMIEAFVSGDHDLAFRYDSALRPLQDALFETANPILVKEALKLQGFPVGGVRLPLVNANEAQSKRLKGIMDETFRRLDELPAVEY
jgi:4-hydroxy-tetrahydrodipicolinate synthase